MLAKVREVAVSATADHPIMFPQGLPIRDPTAIQFWFRCLTEGTGKLTPQMLQLLYQEQRAVVSSRLFGHPDDCLARDWTAFRAEVTGLIHPALSPEIT